MNTTFRVGYEKVTDYEVETVPDNSSPTGVRMDYTFTIEGLRDSFCCLMFYTFHQNVRVYQDGVFIYHMKPSKIIMSGKSPGRVWNEMIFTEEDNGSTIRIAIYPVYRNAIERKPIIYLGDRFDIVMGVVRQEALAVILSVLTMYIGLFYCVVGAFSGRKVSANQNLRMLGIFSMQYGLWKLTDSKLTMLLIQNKPAISLLPFMALLLMCVPFILYIKELFTKDSVVWKICCIASFVDMGAAMILQYNRILDMKQLLVFNHAIIVIVLIIVFIYAIREVKGYGWNKRFKRNAIGLGIFFVGVFADMLGYYIWGDQMPLVLGMMIFLGYIFILGAATMRETRNLIAIGSSAVKYEQMANHDQLTGMFNRTAFEGFVNDVAFNPEKCLVVMMDLNNLKGCNDTYGHDMGDYYITTCASLIKECFMDIGNCYRMGGDEFCVLVLNGSPIVCMERIKELKDKIGLCKPIAGEFKMGVSCGYKMYDSREEYDIIDTIKRADKVMYEDKSEVKNNMEHQPSG